MPDLQIVFYIIYTGLFTLQYAIHWIFIHWWHLAIKHINRPRWALPSVTSNNARLIIMAWKIKILGIYRKIFYTGKYIFVTWHTSLKQCISSHLGDTWYKCCIYCLFLQYNYHSLTTTYHLEIDPLSFPIITGPSTCTPFSPPSLLGL